MVLLANPDFGNGKGMDIHVRTKIRRGHSFIQDVAVRTGDEILEVIANHACMYYLNGVQEAALPGTIDG